MNYEKRVVTFGEIMVRLSTPGHLRFGQAAGFDVNYGGGEADVAVSLANYGVDACFVTRLPDNDIANAAIASLRKHGVDNSETILVGELTGIYYLETGTVNRPSKIVNERAGSSIATVAHGDFDWDRIFEGEPTGFTGRASR